MIGARSSRWTLRGSPVAASRVACDSRRQRPCLSMPTKNGSKRPRSSARVTLRADSSDTSCSADRPPNRITTRSFLLFGLFGSGWVMSDTSCSSRTNRLSRLLSLLLSLLLSPLPSWHPQFSEQKTPLVDQLGDDFGERLAGAVAGLGFEAEQDGVARSGRGLETRGHLARVQWIDAGIGRGGGQQYGGIGDAVAHVVIGRIGVVASETPRRSSAEPYSGIQSWAMRKR